MQALVMQYLKPRLDPLFGSYDDNTIRRNLVKLDIFYRDFNVKLVTQSPDYPVYIVTVFQCVSVSIQATDLIIVLNNMTNKTSPQFTIFNNDLTLWVMQYYDQKSFVSLVAGCS